MILRQTGGGYNMVRVLLLNSDEKLVAEAIAEYGMRDVYVAEGS